MHIHDHMYCFGAKMVKTLEANWILLSVCSDAFVYCVTVKSHVLTDPEDGLLVFVCGHVLSIPRH